MEELKIVIYLLVAIIYLILGIICNFFSSKSIISIITLFASFIFFIRFFLSIIIYII